MNISFNDALPFTESGLLNRAGSWLFSLKHSNCYAFSPKSHACRTCSAPFFRDLVKYPG